MDRLQPFRIDLNQRQIVLLVGLDQLGAHFLPAGQPAGEFALLHLAAFGDGQSIGVDDRGQGHRASIQVKLHDRMPRQLRERLKCAQRLLAVFEIDPRQPLSGVGGILGRRRRAPQAQQQQQDWRRTGEPVFSRPVKFCV